VDEIGFDLASTQILENSSPPTMAADSGHPGAEIGFFAVTLRQELDNAHSWEISVPHEKRV
jgi:hypothetical protein